MRILLGRTDALGDLVVSLPVQARILERDPQAEVHWLVRPYAAPLLEGLPGVSGVHLRDPDTDLVNLVRRIQPHAVLNLSHRDAAIILAAKTAGVPLRVARARGFGQILAATHLLWRGRMRTLRHEAQNALDFLAPLGWDGGCPTMPRLVLTDAERATGLSELKDLPRPRIGVVTRGSGSGACPSAAWWTRALGVLAGSGWNSVILSPPEDSSLQSTNLRGLLGRLAACDAVMGPSTGPIHAAAALDIPVLCLMGRRTHHAPSRWTPQGGRVQVIQYPGPEADLRGGMERLDPAELLAHLHRLQTLGGGCAATMEPAG